MGSDNNKSSEDLEIENFGKKEIVKFKMNIFLITEDNSIKGFFKKLINPQDENINLDRDNPVTHITYKGWKYFYLEKQQNESIKDLLENGFNKIRECKFGNNTFVIYLNNLEENKILEYLKLFINQRYSESEQPFILFMGENNENKIDKKKMRYLLKTACKNYIMENCNDKEKRLKNLIIEEYYMPYNIFLFRYIRNNENNNNNVNQNNNDINQNNNNVNQNNDINQNNNNVNQNNDINQNNNNVNQNNNNVNQINNDNILELQNYLLKFACYYNEIGDYFSLEHNDELSFNFINILCVGRTGAGKSTFINTFFNERKCIIGNRSKSQTKRINYYLDQINHIRIYDTPGFEDENSSNKTKDLLQTLNVELINCKQKIHLILYFIQNESTMFQKCEYEVFNQIVKYNAHIIFIQNKCDDNNIKTYKKEKKILYEGISEIFKETKTNLEMKKISQREINKLRDLYVKIFLNKHENFILMNLRRKENNFTQKIFGIDELKNAIYDFFKDNLINLNDIQKIKELFTNENSSPIYTLIKDNYFLHTYKSINDILCYVQSQRNNIIIKNAMLAGLFGMNPFPLVDIGTYYLIEKKLKRELASLYHFDIKKNDFLNDSLKMNDEKTKKKNKEKNSVGVKTQTAVNIARGVGETKLAFNIVQIAKDINYVKNIKNFFNAIINFSKASLIFTGIGIVIGAGVNAGFIVYEGKKFSDYFEEELKKNNGEEFLKNVILDFNFAINSFNQKKKIVRSSSK